MASGKRSATSELNHDNWDDEVETEEAGTFSQADESTLKGRVIKKAKRRGLASQVKCSLIVKIRQFGILQFPLYFLIQPIHSSCMFVI